MRTSIIVILLIVLTSIACKFVSGIQAPAQKDLSWIFETNENPVDVAVVLETDNTVEALIPVEGGTITATGADGTVYMLEIPADALLVETMIGLTPVSSISGMPFGGEQTYAVQFSPEGLFLQNFAILTITPVAEIPIDQQIFFGYLKDGKDLILAAPVIDSSEIKINVLHFSGNGVTNGAMADAGSLGGNTERRMSSALAEKLGAERARQLLGNEGEPLDLGEAFNEAWKEYEEQVIKPRIAAAGDNCEAGELAIQTVLSHERDRQLLGASDGEGLSKFEDLYNKVARVCILEEFEACVEHHRIWLILPLYDSLLRQNAILPMYSQGTLNEALDLTIKCLTFRLKFESTATVDDGEGGGYESSVTSELILRYDPKAGFILGAVAPLVNTEFEFFSPCGGTSIPGDGVFAVLGMTYEVEGGDPDENGNYPEAGVSDIKLVYSPGNTSESGTINNCWGASVPIVLPAWSTAFLATHLHELDEGGWVAIDWEILEDELFAEKEWNLVSIEDAVIKEEGTFKLYHVPGQ